jgi:hypothetical protein
MIIYINIKTWVGTSASAIHYYGKFGKLDTNKNVYQSVKDDEYSDVDFDDDLDRTIDQKEATFLNKKDGKGSLWKKGMSTIRFNSVDELKETAEKQFKTEDIVFLHDYDLISEESDIIVRNVEKYKYTGQKLIIEDFKGFSPNFKNLTNDSIHKVIETPERYKGKKLQDGYWVIGVYEPALILSEECELLPE